MEPKAVHYTHLASEGRFMHYYRPVGSLLDWSGQKVWSRRVWWAWLMYLA